jgi:hypothetical protein
VTYDDDNHTDEALSRLATQLKHRGKGHAGRPMGAVEAHGSVVSTPIRDGFAQLAEAIQAHTRALSDATMALHALADAIQVPAETLERDDGDE